MRSDLSDLNDSRFDVIVIGGGINGASSAQHLSAAGYSVLLVDKGDFGSGSTSRSTRLLHCGLRYFETPNPIWDFMRAPGKLAVSLKMARAAMENRGELVKDYPDRLRPYTLIFPLLRNGPYKGWQADLAFKILGRYGPPDVPLHYKRYSPEDARHLPFIGQLESFDQLSSVFTFTEYLLDWPERFCIDAVLDAERMGAVARSYTRALNLKHHDGAWSVTLNDELESAPSAIAHAPVLLNMAGIWIDQVNSAGGAEADRLIFGTKGAHVVVKLPDEFSDYGFATVNSLGEPHYCVPSQGGHHHIGPTETVYDGDLDNISVTDSEISFLINETNALMPGLNIREADVISTWAGVRPLGNDPAYPKGKRVAEVHDLGNQGLPGAYAFTGGPIMTYRIAAREITETVSQVQPSSGPAQELNYSARKFPENPNSPTLMHGSDRVRLSDLAHAANEEHGASLSDILIARTGVVYNDKLDDETIRRAAEAISIHAGWDKAEIERQISEFRAKLKNIYKIE